MAKVWIAVLWIACAVHNWGATLGDFSGEFPEMNRRSHYGIAAGMAACGPFAIPATVLGSDFYQHGFVWK